MQIIEWIAVFSGIVAVYLLYKNTILTWPIGFISILCFMILFWKANLYGDFAVQIMFLITGIWGWINWKKADLKLPTTLSLRSLIVWISLTLLSIPLNKYLLETYFTDCSYPLAEAIILSLSIFGQILTTMRKLENWYWWLIADALMIVVYAKKEIYYSSTYAAVILVIGIFGFLHWRKLILESKIE